MDTVAYVYILESTSTGRFYIGYTRDLKERLRTHQMGEGNWTKHKGPWQLVYYETYAQDADARKRELQLKKAKNKGYLRWLTQNGPGNSVR